MSNDYGPFSNRKNATLYVPFGTKTAYLAANHWNEFKQILEFEEDIINFADAQTKAICIANWDTNGDGELNMTEAAAVTSLGTAFKKSQITSFNELQYFTGLTNISDNAFNGSTIKEITLPENITSLGKDAFLDCKSLTAIHIPSKVSSIGQNALSGCTTMTAITVDENNMAFCNIDGVLFNKAKTELVQFPAAKATTYTVPEGTKVIARDAFYMSKLQSVTLPTTLEELGFDAFGYSKSLTELDIPEGVTTIGEYILDGCSGLKTLRIPSTVTTIGGHICNSCKAITDVYCSIMTPFAIAKDNFTTTAYSNARLHVPAFAIDSYKALEGWKYFTNITGDVAITAESYAVVSADGKTLTFFFDNNRDSQTGATYSLIKSTNDPGWLEHAATITNVVFDQSFIYAEPTSCYHWFYHMGELTDITGMEYLNTSKTTSMASMFNSCKKLTSIDLSHFDTSSATSIATMFASCTALTSIDLSKFDTRNVKNMKYMFSNCSALTSIDVSMFNTDKVTDMNYMFRNCSALTSIDVSMFNTSNVTNMENMFNGCEKLTELDISTFTLNSSQNTKGMMQNCTTLQTLTVPETANYLNSTACSGIGTQTSPCILLYPEGFTPESTTTGESWLKWKGGYFCDLASNIIMTEDMTVNVGGIADLAISLDNAMKVDGVQFDLTLPEGLTIASSANGSFEIETTNRSNRLTANCTKQADGKYRFLIFSTDRSIIEPGEGEILKIKVACPTDAAPGNYEMAFSGISLSCVNGSVSVNHDCDDFTANVTIKEVSTMPGDANGDYEVDITDVMMLVRYILEGDVPGFIFANADLDNNEVVNITDVMNAVAIILGGDMSNAPANARTATHDLLRVSPESTGCLLHTTAAAQGITAFQMNVTLPDGCRLNKATLTGEAVRTHKVKTKQMDDGSYNVVMFSMTGNTLPTDAPILNLDIEGRDGMISMEGILCTDTSLETLLSPDISTVLTSIASIQADDGNPYPTPIYNTSGQRLSKTQRGVNISNGKKVLVK